jgi:hypothetical protein
MTESTPTTPANFLDRAKPLIASGFSIFPLQPRDKGPVQLPDGRPAMGVTSATRNLDVVKHWATLYPDANVGIASDTNFTLLETDNERKFRDTLRQITGKELPETLRLGSGKPNRGCWIFKRTAACGDGCLVWPEVFEFRNHNQYVAAPGSIHPEGHTYQWQNAAPVIDFPEWLTPVLVTMAKAYKGEATHAHIKTGPARLLFNAYSIDLDPESMFGMDITVGEGERHYVLLSVAGFLNDGERDADDIYDILIRLRDEYCEAGKGDHELRRIADDIVHREPCAIEPANLMAMNVGTVVYRDQADFDAAVKAYKEGWRNLFHSVAETDDAPPLEFVIDGFLQKDSITMLGGPPGAMKTYAALSIAKSLITGQPLFDYFSVTEQATRVLYLVPESSLGPFVERLKKLNMKQYVQKTFFYRTLSAAEQFVPLTDPRILEAAKGADVFLDTAVRFMDGEENSAADQRAFATNLFALLRAGARTVTGLHHAPKNFTTQNVMNLENVLRGSGDIGAMLATCWGFSKIDEERSQIYVKCVKDRDFRETPRPFVLEGRPHLDETGKFKMTEFPGKARDYFAIKQQQRGRQGGRPPAYGPESLREQAKQLGISKSALQRRLAGTKPDAG